MKRYFLFLVLLQSFSLCAEIRLPRLISDGVVLQRDRDLTLWGWAAAGETVRLSFKDQIFNTTADGNGSWKIILPKQPAGGPHTFVFEGTNKVTISDVLFGDVWLCSGQSNMEIPMERVKEKYPHVILASENKMIRQFVVADKYDFKKRHDDLDDGSWLSASPKNLLSFSAVAYFFARDLYTKYQVPVGLINSALGGSPVEAWISESELKAFPEHYQEMQKFKNDDLIRELEQRGRQNSSAWFSELNTKDRGLHDEPRWTQFDVDDAGWGSTRVPGNWPLDHNGSMWFRKEVQINKNQLNQSAKLWLGRIVDSDSVFVNGKFVATTSYQYPPRRYDVGPDVLREGKNVIAVRMISSSGKGGFVEGKRYYLAIGKDTMDLAGTWKFKDGAVMPPMKGSVAVRWKPGGLFNRMIAPLLQFSIKGVIWYQGESNAERAREYNRLFSTMINDWRSQWGYEFPFLFVQLPNYMEAKNVPTESDWALLRQAQLQTLSVPSTAMVVAIDAGEWNDIHPLNKEVIGKRLALQARKLAYGENNLVASGPVPENAVIKKGTIVVTFGNTGKGLVSRGSKSVNEVAISADGKTYQWASAKIAGKAMVVKIPSGITPRFVRYAWADNPEKANLYNAEGLPATPFELIVK